MAFTDHKIQSFTRKLSDLPDQPNLSAAELKAYFDSSPEELRQAHNAACADAQRLDDRVSGIVTQTFGDAIPKTMLAHELQAELDGKAEQTALAALDTRMTANETLTDQKCELYFGQYTGDDQEERVIELGFTPKAVLLMTNRSLMRENDSCYGGLAVAGAPVLHLSNGQTGTVLEVCDNGFRVFKRPNSRGYIYSNISTLTYNYIALR